MEFDLTEEHKLLRDTIREFAAKEIAPLVAHYEEKKEFPFELARKLADLNILGLIFPPSYGGAGMDYISYCIALEEIARADASTALFVSSHISLCSNHIYIAGDEEQKQKYLVPLARGDKIGAWALTEPNSGSDAAALESRAERRGDGWVMNGSKMFITQGSVADVYVIMAATDKAKGPRGISAFVVEKGAKGLSARAIKDKLGLLSSDTAELTFEDLYVSGENLLGELNAGFSDAMKVLDGGRIGIAAFSLGLARGALEESVKYAKQRKQFGKPIAEFQAIQWKLADMAMEIDAARLLTYEAAWMKDKGLPVTKESAMAKLLASEVAVRACGEAVQIHGGYGFIKEYPVERYYRDVKLCTVGEGTSEIQRLIIARHILSSDI